MQCSVTLRERIFKDLQRKVWIIQNSSFCNFGIYLFSNLVFNYVYYQCSHTTADEKKWLGRKFVTYGDWLSHMICFHHLLFQFICARANYWDDIVRFFERGSTMDWKKFWKEHSLLSLWACFFSWYLANIYVAIIWTFKLYIQVHEIMYRLFFMRLLQ